MDPFVGAYHSRKGDAARFMQKHFEAFENYREALRLNPTDKECIVSSHIALGIDDSQADFRLG